MRSLAVRAGWWVLSVGTMVGLWELAAALDLINRVILPPPSVFVTEIQNQAQFLLPQIGVQRIGGNFVALTAIWASLLRIMSGLALAFIAAVLIGSLAFSLRVFHKLTYPAITLLAPIAPVAWIPFALVAFGIGDGAAIFVVFVGIFFVLELAAVDGMKYGDDHYRVSAGVLAASRRQVVRRGSFPAILPRVFVIVRGDVVGEWVSSVGIVIGIWEITAALGLINTIILPAPHKFVAEIRDQSQFLMPQPGVTAIPLHSAVFTAIGASLRRVLIGLLLGSLAAVLTGSLAFYLRLFRNLTFPTITMLAPIAPAAWIPLAILAFGMGDGAAIFVVFVGIYFTLTLATLNSMNNVDQVYVNTARVLGASRRQIMWHVIFPAILPNLFVVLRMNFFAAWMGVLAAEMVGVRTGLGAVVVMGRQMMNMNLTFLGMAIIGLVGYLLDVGLGLLQKRVLWWRSAARV